jgi:hypothetical protein
VSAGRLRATHVQREQRPVAHTDTTLADIYLRRDRTALTEYQRLVAEVLHTEVDKARAGSRLATLTPDELAEAVRDPATVAARYGITEQIMAELLSGRADTVLAGCVDNQHSPFSPAGQPCQASFLKCLGCPCARAMPHHLPAQVLTLDAVEARRTQLTALRWAERYALVHTQLLDLVDQAGSGAVERARRAATAADHDAVRRLLTRELDHQ